MPTLRKTFVPDLAIDLCVRPAIDFSIRVDEVIQPFPLLRRIQQYVLLRAIARHLAGQVENLAVDGDELIARKPARVDFVDVPLGWHGASRNRGGVSSLAPKHIKLQLDADRFVSWILHLQRQDLIAVFLLAIYGGRHIRTDGDIRNLLIVVIRWEWEPEHDLASVYRHLAHLS